MEQIKENWYYCPHGHKTGQRVEVNSNIENIRYGVSTARKRIIR